MYCARNPSPIRRVVLCSAMQPHPAPHPAAPDDTIGPRMEPALSAPYPPPPVCLIGLLKENSRPGFGVRGSTLHQGPQPFKYLNGVGDSTSVVWNPWPESLKAQQQKPTGDNSKTSASSGNQGQQSNANNTGNNGITQQSASQDPTPKKSDTNPADSVNQLKPLMDAQEDLEYWGTQHVIIPGAMIFSGAVVALGGAGATVGACATGIGCLASPVTVGVALAGGALVVEGVHYAIHPGTIWNPF